MNHLKHEEAIEASGSQLIDPPLTWERLVKAEPRLLQLQASGIIARAAPRHIRHQRFQVLKRQIVKIVGHAAANPELRSRKAFNIACSYVLGGW